MSKIQYTINTDNTMCLEIFNENHTVGNLLRDQLSKWEEIFFVGYCSDVKKQGLIFKIQYKSNVDPIRIIRRTIESILYDLEFMKTEIIRHLN